MVLFEIKYVAFAALPLNSLAAPSVFDCDGLNLFFFFSFIKSYRGNRFFLQSLKIKRLQLLNAKYLFV